MKFDKICFEKVVVKGYCGKLIGVKIIINGVDLIKNVKKIELPYAKSEGNPTLAGEYSYQIADSLYQYLTIEIDEVALLTCVCLCDGCWSLRCSVKETNESVVWNNFRHEHRVQWDYSTLGEFNFEKHQYNDELEKLKGFSEKI